MGGVPVPPHCGSPMSDFPFLGKRPLNPQALATLGEIVADAIWRQLKAQVSPAPSSGAALGGVTMEAPAPSVQAGRAETAETQATQGA